MRLIYGFILLFRRGPISSNKILISKLERQKMNEGKNSTPLMTFVMLISGQMGLIYDPGASILPNRDPWPNVVRPGSP